jgi:hypothetical protein
MKPIVKKYAIIIIDAWETNSLDNRNLTKIYDEMIQNITRLLKLLPDECVAIVASYENKNITTHQNLLSICWHKNNILVSIDREEIIEFLDKNNVEFLYYTGKSCPGCVTDRPVGLRNMPDKYKKSIIIDCVLKTTSLEKCESDVIHDTYHSVFDMSRYHGWDIVWSKMFEHPYFYY